MPYWIWIVIALVIVVLVVLSVAFVLGRRRRVSLKAGPSDGSEPDSPIDGGYRASGGFSFAPGGASTVAERPPADESAPEATPTDPIPTEPPPVDPGAEQAAAEALLPPGHGEPAATDEPSSAPDDVIPETPVAAPDDVTVGEAAPTEAAPTEAAPTEAAPTETAPTEAPPEIAPTAGRLSKLRGRLARSQSTLGRSLLGILGAGDLDEDSWEDIEDTLVMADLGAATALEIASTLRERIASEGVANAAEAKALLRSVLIDALGAETDRSVHALPHDGHPAAVLVVGVNGTGKTTTTGKLARVLVADGHSVLLGAADTFRAAAADQLATWAERSGASLVRGAEGADPAAVAFDAVKTGAEQGRDVVLIDTAGRLHTKAGLMDQLGKVKRVAEKQTTVDEVLLVLDATTGQNGMAQAKVFAEVVDVTGIVLTKLDGTAKGGIVLAVQRELGVPVKLVGLGEGPDDLAPFEPEAFVDALLGE